MPRSSFSLSRLHRIVLHGAFAVLFVSGVAWAVLSGELTWPGYRGELERAEIVPWLLDIHGAAAIAALLVLGSLVPQHIKWAWKGQLNRLTGSLMIGTQTLLVGTGYGLYYAGDDMMRTLSQTLHLALGLAFPLLILGHIVNAARPAPGKPPRDARPQSSPGV